MARKPTDAEFTNYDGMHCRLIWKELPSNWHCPVCDRNRRDILVWGERKGSNAREYGPIGFKCAIHNHHDHGADYGSGRFPDTHICGSCNLLDARLKRKVESKRDFSFSPKELKSCLMTVRPNEGIKQADIDYERAMEIYTVLNLLPKD